MDEAERVAWIEDHLTNLQRIGEDDGWWLLTRYHAAVRAWRHTTAEREALRGLLGRIEWGGPNSWMPPSNCPVCRGWPAEGHKPGCELAKVLGHHAS